MSTKKLKILLEEKHLTMKFSRLQFKTVTCVQLESYSERFSLNLLYLRYPLYENKIENRNSESVEKQLNQRASGCSEFCLYR